MPEKPLLLSAAKLPISASVLAVRKLSPPQMALVAVWILISLVGLVDIVSHVRSNGPAQPETSTTSSQTLAVGPAFADLNLATATGGGLSSAAGAATSAVGITPARLSIPSLGVSATVEQVALASDGSLETPSSFSTTAWYKDGPKPGEPGNAIIDGHVNNALTQSGVFEHLNQLRLGDIVTVSDSSGKTLSFIVSSEQLYSLDNAPASEIFARSGPSELVLITCDGAWDQGKKEFNERLVVYATLHNVQ